MGGLTQDYNALYDLAVGDIQIGGIHISFDLTGGLTREQFINKAAREDTGTCVTKSGRIIMPKANIY